MFQDFAKRKFSDYLALLEFPAGRISLRQVKSSSLPPYIISFLEYYIPNHNLPIDKRDFKEILNKAIIFNINYIIKPKNTILKFVFADVETRPVHYVKQRLRFFQFYGYYLTQIIDFIDFNDLEVVSYNQIEHLINEVNKKIFEEISFEGSDSHRLNLVKLLYYFFHDLGDNNPINIKLPRKILSVYFQDKGYMEIKKRVDGFFSSEIFIQEAIELMDPGTIKSPRKHSDIGVSDQFIKEIVSKAKTDLINKETANREVEKILRPEDEVISDIPDINITIIREQESKLPEIEKSRLIIDEEIYSDDLMFASQFNDITPPVQLTEEEKLKRTIDDLFCEESYRKRIIRQIFKKDEFMFDHAVRGLLQKADWNEAIVEIEELFEKNKVDYFSEEAVKFVDIIQSHYVKDFFETKENKAI